MKPSNLLKIDSLDIEWRDKDHIMLHACFQLLKDCVEKENLLNGHTDWDYDEKQRKTKQELEKLYHWWEERIQIGDLSNSQAVAQYEKDSEMLIRLINIRWALWT